MKPPNAGFWSMADPIIKKLIQIFENIWLIPKRKGLFYPNIKKTWTTSQNMLKPCDCRGGFYFWEVSSRCGHIDPQNRNWFMCPPSYDSRVLYKHFLLKTLLTKPYVAIAQMRSILCQKYMRNGPQMDNSFVSAITFYPMHIFKKTF